MASKSKTANIGRLSEIVQVAVKHGFGSLLEGRRAPAEVDAIRGRHLREMFDELGPTFVKFGQLLSTRPDIVPEDIIVELRGLQNDVTPFPFADVERVIAEDLKQPIGRLFLEFDEVPMAAASIGQVHRAVLPNGKQVAVKVQRPNAPRQVESDIQLLEQAARFIKERVHALDFVDSREVVDEFARSLRQELDYRQEASNAQASTATSPATRTSSSRASTGATRVSAFSRSSISRASSSRISRPTTGRWTSAAGWPTSSPRPG